MKKFDFTAHNEEELQNVVLTEAIKALNNGLVPIFVYSDLDYDYDAGGDIVWYGGYGIHPIKKEFAESIGINISDNPKFEDVAKLQFLLQKTALGYNFKGIHVVKEEEIPSIVQEYSKEDDRIIVNDLIIKDIFDALWNDNRNVPDMDNVTIMPKYTSKLPKPTGKYAEVVVNEAELPF